MAPPDPLQSEPASIQRNDLALTGTIDGESVRLRIGGEPINGRLDGDKLELVFAPDGRAETARFKAASKDDFMAALRHIRAGEQRRVNSLHADALRARKASDTPQKTVAGFLAASGNDDGTLACSYLTANAQQTVAADLSADAGATCEAAITYVASKLKSEQTAALKSARITSAAVKGDKATVKDSDIASTDGSLPSDPDPAPYQLEKIDGAWKISDLG